MVNRNWWIGNTTCVGFGPNTSNDTVSACFFQYGSLLPIIALLFDALSIFGSIFIIVTYYTFRDLRTKARLILLMIAIADLVNSISYGVSFIYSLAVPGYALCYPDKPAYEIGFCVGQATFSNFSNNASIVWTFILGIHITLLICGPFNVLRRKRNLIIISLLAWGIPASVSVLGLFLNVFGPGYDHVSVGWCFISSYDNAELKDGHFWLELVFAKIWEIGCFVVLAIVYSISCVFICKQPKSKEDLCRFFTSQDVRLIWIPFVFVLLRIWGNIRWAVNLPADFNTGGDLSCPDYQYALSVLQSIGDPGQGWMNALVYIVFNQMLRKRIFNNFKLYCCPRRHNLPAIRMKNGEKSRLVSRMTSAPERTESIVTNL